MFETTALAKPPIPSPPKISILGGPHLNTLELHPPVSEAIYSAFLSCSSVGSPKILSALKLPFASFKKPPTV